MVGSLLAVVVLLILVAVAITIVWKHCNNNRREANKGIINIINNKTDLSWRAQ